MNFENRIVFTKLHLQFCIRLLLFLFIANCNLLAFPLKANDVVNSIPNHSLQESDTKYQYIQKKNVLVLNSYHEGFHWTDEVMEGIKSVTSNQNIELFVTYMDTKRCADDDYFLFLKNLYKKRYENIKFDAIISTDDHALNFLLDHGDDLFPNVPVSFCGINDYHTDRIQGHDNFTGVYETYDVKGTINLIKKVHPKVNTIAFITDNTISGQAFKNRVKRAELSFNKSIHFMYLSGLDVDSLRVKLSNLNPYTVVVWGIYLRTPDGHTLTSEEGVSLATNTTNVPTYCIWDVVGQGVVGGKITSPFFQGEEAAKKSLRLLNNDNIKDISVSGSPMVYKFDHNVLEKFMISESDLPENSIIINEPFSLLKRYKKIIWTVITIITVLFLIVLALMFLIRKIKATTKVLQTTNQKLEIAKEKAEESDRLKTSFLANLSHEIRTPMNGIIGFAELLDYKDLTQEKQKKYLGLIRTSGQRMLNLINNLVDISKIETEQIEYFEQKTNLNEVMNELYLFFKPLTDKKNLNLNCLKGLSDASCSILTDQQRLEQVMINLITNSVKFTKEGSIHFSYEIKESQIYFSVKDTGPGIADDKKDVIFERFRQINADYYNEEEGIGLGLAISKSLIELMGGEIGVISEFGNGSEFYFVLPYKPIN